MGVYQFCARNLASGIPVENSNQQLDQVWDLRVDGAGSIVRYPFLMGR